MRYLREHDVAVVEVNQPHAHTRRRAGKSDPIDAEMAARVFQAGKAKSVPKQTDGIVESIRLPRVARESAVKSRSTALVQVCDPLITGLQELRDRLSGRKTLRGKVTVCAGLRPSGRDLRSPYQAAKFALRATAQRIEGLGPEIVALDRELEQLVAVAAPRPFNCSASRAGTQASRSSPLERTSTDSAARLALDALRRQPDPSLLWQDDPPPPELRRRSPSQPRAAEGKTQREIMRCQKRHIALEVYDALRADLADSPPPAACSRGHDQVRHSGLRDHAQTHLTSIGTSPVSSVAVWAAKERVSENVHRVWD